MDLVDNKMSVVASIATRQTSGRMLLITNMYTCRTLFSVECCHVELLNNPVNHGKFRAADSLLGI